MALAGRPERAVLAVAKRYDTELKTAVEVESIL